MQRTCRAEQAASTVENQRPTMRLTVNTALTENCVHELHEILIFDLLTSKFYRD